MSDLHQSICELIYNGESVKSIADKLQVNIDLVVSVYNDVSQYYDCSVDLTEEI